jgi:hypothetical protein
MARKNTHSQFVMDDARFQRLLLRSAELEQALFATEFALHPGDSPEQAARFAVSYSACCISVEHNRGLRLLLSEDCHTSAIALMRLQYEALVRSMWAMYAATDLAISKLGSALNTDTEIAAKNLPTLSKMLEALDGKGPAPAVVMLLQFKTVMVSALNSFVHGGIHAVQRSANGYPVDLLLQVIRSSNGLLTMAGAMLAILSGDQARMKVISGYQIEYRDCLPELVKPI